jgi:hypothetical protein
MAPAFKDSLVAHIKVAAAVHLSRVVFTEDITPTLVTASILSVQVDSGKVVMHATTMVIITMAAVVVAGTMVAVAHTELEEVAVQAYHPTLRRTVPYPMWVTAKQKSPSPVPLMHIQRMLLVLLLCLRELVAWLSF